MATLFCMDCGQEEAWNSSRFRCACGGTFDIRQTLHRDDAERLKRLFDERLRHRTGVYASGVWRYKELIAPELPEEAVITRGEGNTGLYEAESLRRRAGVRKLWIKALGENPSGSFKDHGMTAAVSHGTAIGKSRFICASTGNTAASLAMYASWAGAAGWILVSPGEVAANKLLQTLAYGGTVIPVEGGYDAGIRFLTDHAEPMGVYLCNSVNPWRIEGQKSIVYELAHQLNWEMPDWLVLPGGALSNATAAGKALAELHTLGFIRKLPRIAIVQAEGASPFHRMVEAGERELTSVTAPLTRASALRIGDPPNWRKALAYAIQGTNGVTTAVTDEAILAEKRAIDRAGIGCEPASAASLAGLAKLVRLGVIHPDETAVCLLTGGLLKDTDALAALPASAGEAASPIPDSPVPLLAEAFAAWLTGPLA
ncbi:threonine synthase [Paenibacillus sp. J31TS4]|uniref:threonine synthase n=1 Tax=Paenibacillus sp. J31TS4 TaxID=2807195 RepID=UPI001B0741F8|nr:threonine synthase [Paenibacillus sp. J31TS4]GIP37662.1 threonine synthase [Paenibacillus sp. J31TS4]